MKILIDTDHNVIYVPGELPEHEVERQLQKTLGSERLRYERRKAYDIKVPAFDFNGSHRAQWRKQDETIDFAGVLDVYFGAKDGGPAIAVMNSHIFTSIQAGDEVWIKGKHYLIVKKMFDLNMPSLRVMIEEINSSPHSIS